MANKKVGAKLRLTEEMIDKICGYLQEGNYLTTVAKLCRIDNVTLHRWLATGREHIAAGDENSIYAKLVVRLEEADAKCEAYLVACVKNGGATDWKAAMTMLERKYKKRDENWTSKQEVEQSGEVKKVIKISFDENEDEQEED